MEGGGGKGGVASLPSPLEERAAHGKKKSRTKIVGI